MDYYNYQNYINNTNNSHLQLPLNSDDCNSHYYQGFSSYPNYNQNLNYDVSVNQELPVAVPHSVELKSDDELYIETWLSKIGKIHINLDSTIQIIPSNRKPKQLSKTLPQLHAIKNSLKNCLHVIMKLQNAKDLLEKNVETLTSAEWKEKTVEIGVLKDEFSKLINQFENREFMITLMRAVKMRKKKRNNRKKRKAIMRDVMAKKIEKRQILHKNLNEWLENMKDAVEHVKMEENMKKDADCVLAEVNKKKSDARKHISLITSLVKLRSVREQVAEQRGEKTSQEDHNAFSLITGHLLRMWENSMQVYSKEEQGLKIMLEQNAIEDSKAANLAKEQNIIRDWEFVLFGPKCIPSAAYWGLTSADKSMETFIAIRHSWDTFLVPHHNEHGSKIPIGWVMPNSNASEGWRKYLKINN